MVLLFLDLKEGLMKKAWRLCKKYWNPIRSSKVRSWLAAFQRCCVGCVRDGDGSALRANHAHFIPQLPNVLCGTSSTTKGTPTP